MALFSIPAKYMTNQQTVPVIEKQLEDIYLKVTVVRKITSVKVSLDNGQIYHSHVREKEDPPVLIPVGEKETVSESRSQGEDNSDQPELDSIRHTTKFNLRETLVDVIHLTEEVGIKFSSRTVEDAVTSRCNTELEDVNNRTSLTVTADIVPLTHHDRTSPGSNHYNSDGDSFEAPSLKEVSSSKTNSYDAMKRKYLDIKMSPAHVLDDEDNARTDVSELLTIQGVSQQTQSSDAHETINNDELLFNETASQESVDLPGVEIDVDEEINFTDSEVSTSVSINRQPEPNLETALKHKPFSAHQKQKAIITKKIRGSDCLFCYARFPLKKLYNKHMEEGIEFVCELCSGVFKSQCLLKQHWQKHFKQDSKCFTCLMCRSQFSTQMSFLKHACRGSPVSCKVCCESFTDLSFLNKHMQSTHGTQSCAVCQKFFLSEESLKRHRVGCLKTTQVIKLESGDFKCLICAGLFKSISLYIKHRKISNLEKALNKCVTCGKLCPSPCSLNLHSGVHSCESNSKSSCNTCTICKQAFQSRHLYLSHMQDVPGKGYICSTSSRVTRSKTNFQNSSRHMESKTTFPCDKCQLVFPSRYWLKKHCLLKGCRLMKKGMPCSKFGKPAYKRLQVKFKPKVFKFRGFTCETCGKQCSTQKTLSGHMQTHQGQMQDGRYRCDVCDKTYEGRGGYLKHHIKVHCDRTNFVKCPNCKNIYANEQSLKKHLIAKHQDVDNRDQELKSYYCKTCEKLYTTKTSIFRHKVSKVCKRFTCKTCKKRCTNEKILAEHLLIHEEQMLDGKYHCVICNKTYSRRTGYLKHKRKAQCDLTNFLKCSSCDNVFTNEKALTIHKKTVHKEGESYYCDICKRYFISRKAFNRHKTIGKCYKPTLRRPAGHFRKSAQCDTCGKIFSNEANLIRHMRRHTGDRPFICTQCGKCFADKCILKSHIRNVHIGTRSFLCQVCGKSFKTWTHLDRHTQSHTEKNLHCSFCTRKYKYAKTLLDHQKKMHASLLTNMDLHQMGLVE